MFKRILLVALAIFALGSGALFFWARSIFTQDNVRTTIAGRLTDMLGQPVTVGGIGAAIYPRVAIDLKDVSMGPQSNIRVGALSIGTDFRALISRRVEHGTIRLTGARVQLPLPTFAAATKAPSASAAAPAGAPPVEIVSIDEIILSDVEIVGAGRTLRGDIEVVPEGNGLLVKKVALVADDTHIDVTGKITDLSGPSGELAIKAGALDLSRLLAFVSAFSRDLGAASTSSPSTATASASASPSALNLTLSVDADRATLGALALSKLSGRAHVTAAGMTLDPASLGVFGGRYAGSLALTLGAVPEFRLKAKLSGIDVAAATAFAGSPNTISGTLAGDVDISGRGLDATSIENSARGTVRLEIANGVVKNLGLIQAVVVATSMRSGASAGSNSRDEPFTRLGGTMTIARGEGTTQNLQMEAKDVSLGASGAVRLDGRAIDLKGRAQLSDALSKQAGRDLVRYTQEQGRVTLPATITGTAQAPHVSIDVADVAKRAITNRANEEEQKAISAGLGSLFKKK